MVQEAKLPVKNLVRQRCVEGFNSGLKGLMRPGYNMIPNEVTVAQAVLHELSLWTGTGSHNPKTRLSCLSFSSVCPHISTRPQFDRLCVILDIRGASENMFAKIQIWLKSGENVWHFE
jgi:hypothetical protein